MDKRIEKLAHILVHHSIQVKKGETILVRSQGLVAKELVIEVAKLITLAGAHPRVDVSVPGLGYTFLKHATKKQLGKKPDIALYEAKKIDGIISIGAEYNTKELTSIDPGKIAIRRKATKEISEIIIEKKIVGWAVNSPLMLLLKTLRCHFKSLKIFPMARSFKTTKNLKNEKRN